MGQEVSKEPGHKEITDTLQTYLFVAGAKSKGEKLAPLAQKSLTTREEVRTTYSSASGQQVWIAANPAGLANYLVGCNRRIERKLLLWEAPSDPQTLDIFRNYFQTVWLKSTFSMLPIDELAEVVRSSHPEHLFLGGYANKETKIVTLIRGNMESLMVPFADFGADGTSPKADFSKLRVTDFGQIVKIGQYETSAASLLFRFDKEYRRYVKEEKLQLDRSFGASLKRLRLLRGLSQSDFEPEIARRQIIRLENNEIASPRKQTLAFLAQKLQVSPDEIETY